MRKLKQMTAIGLSILSIAQCFSPVFAEGEVTNTISEAGSLSSDVTYSQDSYFTVNVPKKIVLDSNKSATYHVNVTGDIYGNQTITVTPDTEITLKDANGKGDVTATVSQNDTVFEYADIKAVDESGEMVGKTVEGSISAEDLTAGEWKGTLNFNVALENTGNETPATLAAGLYDANDVMLCSWEDSGIDVETDYTYSTYKTATTSPYYVLTNNYPTATKVVIPDDVTKMGNYAFYKCSNLTSVTIPDSVTSIGEYAFCDCSGLTSITIPNSVTSIGDCAFEDCSNLTSITIPSSVTSIRDYAFYGCSSLTSITIPNSVTSIGDDAFYKCSNLTSITIPNSVTSIGLEAFEYCSSLTSITIPSSVTSIGDYAFSRCSSLTSITIPSSVTSIWSETFSYCSSLTSITIPNSVTSIWDYAFNGCSSLTSITIPSSVTSIGSYAFKNCSSLTNATFENPTGWYVGSSAGVKTTALRQSSLANTSTAADCLRSTYYDKYWTRQ